MPLWLVSIGHLGHLPNGAQATLSDHYCVPVAPHLDSFVLTFSLFLHYLWHNDPFYHFLPRSSCSWSTGVLGVVVVGGGGDGALCIHTMQAIPKHQTFSTCSNSLNQLWKKLNKPVTLGLTPGMRLHCLKCNFTNRFKVTGDTGLEQKDDFTSNHSSTFPSSQAISPRNQQNSRLILRKHRAAILSWIHLSPLVSQPNVTVSNKPCTGWLPLIRWICLDPLYHMQLSSNLYIAWKPVAQTLLSKCSIETKCPLLLIKGAWMFTLKCQSPWIMLPSNLANFFQSGISH